MKFKQRITKKKVLKVFLIIVLVSVIGVGGYSMYGLYRIDQLSKMTFEEMIAFTTKDRKDAIITVGIIKNGEITYVVYGENGGVLPFEEHLYEIGSITKTFTTTLLCKAVQEGKISLDRSIDEYLNLPSQTYYPNISKLVTHTSGYKGHYFEKPMISNFLKNQNSFSGISKHMLLERLKNVSIEDKDYSFKYSNFGMATIGLVLESIYDQDYVTLMNEFVTQELQLKNTKISVGQMDASNYWKWSQSDAYLPAGAMISTITDMMHYTKMQLIDPPEYLLMAQKKIVDVNGSSTTHQKMGIYIDAVGAGWMMDEVNQITWHNGGTGNFNSYLGFDQKNQIGVVILSNLSPSFRIPATIMGIELLTSLQASFNESH